ncbi:MAG: sugar ABC transporter permease [Treponema sp.]|jgi:raffinose/stachyose/melibiose transport system permease protein|nr:sugar ABC transporter permease [Treponema sp.]
MKINRERQICFALFTAPGLALYALFFIFPVIMGFYYGMTDWNGITRRYHFIGLRNFFAVFQDKRFGRAILFNLRYCVLLTACIAVLGIVIALLLNRKIRGITFFRAAHFLPAVLSGLTVGLIFNQILYRALPPAGQALGIGWLSNNLLSSPRTAMTGILFVHVWQGVSMPTLLFLAGLQAVPEELLEAAAIDGAGPFRRFRQVTFPFLLPVLSVVMVLTVKSGLMVFDYVKALTDGGPGGSTESISLLIYSNAFVENKYSYAIAEAVLAGVLIALISAVQISITNKKMA